MPVSINALALLDRIEAIEMASLEWGFTDGSLSEDDALSLAAEVCNIVDGQDLIEELIEARLLFEMVGTKGEVCLRSRFAEMMRLLSENRQLFPGKPWQSAPSLVADFRVDRRPRRFPKRQRLADYPEIFGASQLRRDLWSGLTSRPGGMRLAGFQERAVQRLSSPTHDGGTIVTAGTGSGKTIAFYLPGMMRIGEAISAEYWVKAIAIYPRIELLKDQFAEAFRMARTIDAPLARHGRRSLLLGALFAKTPARANESELLKKKWERHGNNFICPWMRCPHCDSELVWRGADIQQQIEQLFCVQETCGTQIGSDQIVLTRSRIQRTPPDILFTTTEILNQRLSDQWMRGVFGVGVPASRKPLMALLDEVHTYEGGAGAQAALTLRRWRHLLDAPISWVGLSATLDDAARFFSELTGTNPSAVVEITPKLEEFEEEGAEYQILLRADPASRASLLSTTIQTSMLLPRLLDPPGLRNASGVFGRRAFLFTDDLDVTNRLFDDLRDAEAYTIYGRPDMSRRPLASLRGPGPDAALRDVAGQRWRICEDIGHPLDQRLVVGRTTSQDAGVNQSANVVVATAALEVGFNDPFVGAVIQHKAPRGMASFLQRKGRAGRDRKMRPITLTVLSDYGRDRTFYQDFEYLFDPLLEPQYLPIRNPYIMKMQAVFVLFDWLAATSTGRDKVWMWNILSRPLQTMPPNRNDDVIQRIQKQLGQLVQGDPQTIEDLKKFLMGALGIDRKDADILLWEAPRSLLLEAVPTLLRRLFNKWELAFPSPAASLDIQSDYHPLPDFVPRSLFSDLNLPEVRIIVPAASVNDEERIEHMPLLQALTQFVPGRVSRRFAHERGALSHWIPVDLAPQQNFKISTYAPEHEFVGTFTGHLNDYIDGESLLVFRPWMFHLERLQRINIPERAESIKVLPSSQARLLWQSEIVTNGDALCIPVPRRSEWSQYISGINFYLHRFRSSLSVRRFAATAHATIKTPDEEYPVALTFVSDDDRPAALGFELEVDGFRLDLKLPTTEMLTGANLPPDVLATSKLAYICDLISTDTELPSDLNHFQRIWLSQFLISALFADASAMDRPLADTITDLLSDEHIEQTFSRVMSDVFGVIPLALPDDEDTPLTDNDDDNAAPDMIEGGRLQQALLQQVALPRVKERLRVIARQFVEVDEQAFSKWLRRLVLETLGEAMLQACIASAPRQATMDAILVDIYDDANSDVACIWISEKAPGGAGILEAFAEQFASNPRLFFVALDAALAPSDLELVDGSLREILKFSVNDATIGERIEELRQEKSHTRRAVLWRELSHCLAQRGGIDLSHALSISLNNRLLRTGAGQDLDRLLLELQTYWDALEERFGMAIGLREFAYIAYRKPTFFRAIHQFLAETLSNAAITDATVLSAITSLLWPRAHEVRRRVLQSYNPYREGRPIDPAVVRNLLRTRLIITVGFNDPDWENQLIKAFREEGTARLTTDPVDSKAFRAALVRLVATPVDVGVLQFFPAIEGVERLDGRILVTFTLREQV
ncbi:protein DpdJ [Novacetimonas pomaceti]|uniref:Helicase C-terminal domain-containing protein n=1 Tax=Novacetimonas pomaceti TaxID=2021998 RepID=A0ABX5NY16_9PROT|nr:protein DpdJ [Novacetimonas pomaceti]PYD46395.1 hypothetical protein C3920_15520 [Novacetimonas pomaceti]